MRSSTRFGEASNIATTQQQVAAHGLDHRSPVAGGCLGMIAVFQGSSQRMAGNDLDLAWVALVGWRGMSDGFAGACGWVPG